MAYRITLSESAFATLVTVMLISASIPSLPHDALIAVAFAAGPYPLLALLAWRERGDRVDSWVLLSVAVLLSVEGLSLFAYDSYRYHTVAEHRMVKCMTILVVPMLQFAVTVGAGLALWVKRAIGEREKRFSISSRPDR